MNRKGQCPDLVSQLERRYIGSWVLKAYGQAVLGELCHESDDSVTWKLALDIHDQEPQCLEKACWQKHPGVCEEDESWRPCLIFADWAVAITKQQEVQDRYQQFMVLRHDEAGLFCFVRVGGGTLHSGNPRIIFFPLVVVFVVPSVEAARTGDESNNLTIYKLADTFDLDFSDYAFAFAEMKGPRWNLIEPAMLTQHEFAAAPSQGAPADEWCAAVVEVDVNRGWSSRQRQGTDIKMWVRQRHRTDMLQLGLCAIADAQEDDGKDKDMHCLDDDDDVPQHVLDLIIERGGGSRVIRTAIALIGGEKAKKKTIDNDSECSASGSEEHEESTSSEPAVPKLENVHAL